MAKNIKVFLSHSACKEDKGLIEGIEALAKERRCVKLWIAERNFEPGSNIIEKVKSALTSCDCVWALLTHKGNASMFVQNEIGAASILGMHIIPMLEEGEELYGMMIGKEYVRFDRTGQVVKILDNLDFLERKCEKIKGEKSKSSDELVRVLNTYIRTVEAEASSANQREQKETKLASSTEETKDKQLYDLAFEVGMQGRHEAAEVLYSAYLKTNPDAVQAYNNLGAALSKQGKFEEGIEAYQKAIKLRPDYGKAHFNLGVSFWKQGKTDEAIEAYRKAIQHIPKEPEPYNNMGAALRKLGDLEKAIEVYRKAIQIKPDYAFAYNNLGIALREKGDLEEAEKAFRKAIELNPSLAESYLSLGVLLWEQGKYEETEYLFKKTTQLMPDYPDAHYNLACSYARKGMKQEAITSLRTAVEKDYNDWPNIDSDENLNMLRDDPQFKELAEKVKEHWEKEKTK